MKHTLRCPTGLAHNTKIQRENLGEIQHDPTSVVSVASETIPCQWMLVLDFNPTLEGAPGFWTPS